MGVTKILMEKKSYTIVPEDEEVTISSEWRREKNQHKDTDNFLVKTVGLRFQ
jgi:hypothetical protein